MAKVIRLAGKRRMARGGNLCGLNKSGMAETAPDQALEVHSHDLH
jgi:hypothetical protein